MEIIFHQSSYRVLSRDRTMRALCYCHVVISFLRDVLIFSLFIHTTIPVFSAITSSTSVPSLLVLLGTVVYKFTTSSA